MYIYCIFNVSTIITNPAKINIRIDAETKSKAFEVLNLLGLNATEAINLLFKQIIYTQSIPFEIKLPPNKEAKQEPDSTKE